MIQENKNTTIDDEVLFEICDYSYIFIELGFFAIAIIFSIIIIISYGSISEAYVSLTSFGQFGLCYMIFRGMHIIYLAFFVKIYKIVFYKNYIIRTKTNEIRYLNDLKDACNIFWQMSTNKTAYWNPIKIVFLIIAIPAQFFILFLNLIKVIGVMIYSKSFFVNHYSLVLVFKDECLINLSYGFLTKEEKKLLDEYFFNDFTIDNLEKSFLMLPAKKGDLDE